MSKRKNNLDDFIKFLGEYRHHPDVSTDCDFGDHWYCSCGWSGYSYSDWIEHMVEEYRA